MFQVYNKAIQLYTCIFILFRILFHYSLLQNIDYLNCLYIEFAVAAIYLVSLKVQSQSGVFHLLPCEHAKVLGLCNLTPLAVCSGNALKSMETNDSPGARKPGTALLPLLPVEGLEQGGSWHLGRGLFTAHQTWTPGVQSSQPP